MASCRVLKGDGQDRHRHSPLCDARALPLKERTQEQACVVCIEVIGNRHFRQRASAFIFASKIKEIAWAASTPIGG